MSSSFSFALHLLLTLTSITSFPAMKTLPPPTMDPLELETLFKIMETMSSDLDWRGSYPNPCQPGSSWPGIQCKPAADPLDDKHVHVSRLDFGTPPNPSCKRTATFPPQIFQLPRLESVFIFRCFNHTPTTITLPPNKPPFAAASSLQQFSLRSNPALFGEIPPRLSSIGSLQIITLSQNRLTGRIPVEIFGLTSLLHLDLSYNTLAGTIPAQVGDVKKLVGLDLSYNELDGAIPSSIGGLRDLQKLDLSSNSLTGGIPDTIEHMESLVFLALSNNRLSGRFPRGVTGLRNLQYFLMDDNPTFDSLPSELGQLKKLQELRLSNSKYSGTIPSSYSQLTNLSSLSLQNNRLTGPIPSGFANLSHIYHLNLSRNFLEGVVPFESGFLKRLGRNLDLSGNPGLCLIPFENDSVYNNNNNVDVCNKTKSPLKKSDDVKLKCCNNLLLYVVNVAYVLLQLM